MMKYINLKKQFVLLAIIAFVFSACKKIKTSEPMGDAGQTLIKMISGGPTNDPGHVAYGIDFVNIPITLTVADVRRDVPNSAELNKTITVVVKDDTAALRAYNPALVPLPPAWYTFGAGTPKTGGAGGTFTLTLNPGEFAKPIKITIPNATLLNPSALYGLAFTIQSASEGTIREERTVIVEIGAKNPYDGIYSYVSGFVQRYSAPGAPTTGDALNGPLGPANPDVTMTTTGANSVVITGITWAFAGGIVGVGGIDGLTATVNPATNLVTMSATGNATLTNWAGYENKYDPATKTFTLNFRWNPAGLTREYTVVWKYKGPR